MNSGWAIFGCVLAGAVITVAIATRQSRNPYRRPRDVIAAARAEVRIPPSREVTGHDGQRDPEWEAHVRAALDNGNERGTS